jgi:hypothetical protein
MKLNHCHSAECAQIVEALTAKATAYMEMMDANAKELDRLMTKKWIGLTDEEFVELCSADLGTAALIRAVEAKLKENNT